MVGRSVKKRDQVVIIEELVIIVGLLGVQCVYAGNSAVLSYLMSIGLHPSSLIILTTFATFLLLSPFAFLFERQVCLFSLSFSLHMHL